MINLIPMAGLGNRFSKEGYKQPKPLIPVAGKPMIARVIELMPKADKWIFILRKEQVDQYQVDQIIKSIIPNTEFIIIDHNTEGQLSSCLLARDLIDNDEELFIGACDHGFIYEEEKFNKLRKDSDVISWVFTRQRTLKENPNAWGWVKTDAKDNVLDVSVKKPISSDPFNDYAITGAFYFKSGKIFLDIADRIIKNNIRTNNEYYVDSVIGYAPKMKYKTKVFLVNKYVSWGNPDDYEEFNYWLETIRRLNY